MKKRKIANLVMAAIILVIAIAGVLTAGYIRGWFDQNDGEAAVLTEIRGTLTLQREGVAYPVQEDTVLRTGDIVTCGASCTAKITAADGYLVLGEKAGLEVTNPASQGFAATVTGGEVFVNAAGTVTLSFDGKEAAFTDAVASLSVRAGAQSVSVFAGTVGDAQAGQMLDWVGDTLSVTELSITTLNDFNMEQIRIANESMALCFTNEDLDQLKADRLAEMKAQTQSAESAQPAETAPETRPTEDADSTEPSTAQSVGTGTSPGSVGNSGASTATQSSEEKPASTEPRATEPQATEPPVTEPPVTEPPVTEPPAAETEAPATEPQETEAKLSCTLSIRCDTILDNWDSLDPAKAGYVPSDGWILYTTVSFTEGETVFDVLTRACSDYGIQIEYSWTPMYGSYYIEGIHHLYEFDCGYESGWMYKVNGWFPNYGCSSYTLSDGDNIVWCYTCNGLGADVGA